MKTNDVQSVVGSQRAGTFFGLGLLTVAFALPIPGKDVSGRPGVNAATATTAFSRGLERAGVVQAPVVLQDVGKLLEYEGDVFGDWIEYPKGIPVDDGILQVGRPNRMNDSQTEGDDERALTAMQVPMAVAARRGLVWSPYRKDRLVQVSGAKPGDCFLCPYTQRLMSIPADFRDRSDVLDGIAAIGVLIRDLITRLDLRWNNAVPQPLEPADPRQQTEKRQKIESDKSATEENEFSDILILSLKEALIVADLPGFVRSPYTSPPRLVDAKDAKAGAAITCPYTHREMVIPAGFQGTSSSVAPSLNSNEAAPVEPQQNIPWGARINGRPGFVNSPFAARHQLVDVSGLSAGMEVKCPYSGKLFRVPPKVEP